MKRIALLSLMLLIGQPALADGTVPDRTSIALSTLLPPPPAAGTAAATQDLQAVLAAQRSRTSAEQSAAKADMERSVFRFADALGLSMQAATLPKTALFFGRVADFDKAEVKDAKLYWRRARPPVTSDQVHPLSQEKPDDWSYPSGHATFGYTAAVLLANMVPEKRAAIFARADLYAQHRVVMGVHFPSDVEAGRLAGTVIGAQLLQQADWQADYQAARAELRAALQLPVSPAQTP
ncbi:phosphatase PAP2 family protein [Dyella kyungheensis]|uniref:Acid phosphatase n=1 Tax=Dyella kyungheensis TaxID=1242174 RepID=A0ABS2JNJ3_9GAMM|nr:phosphatase PAP2 family protein [Dyella kyungheensis]MBM7119968.1 phosphatase PAP2 family protein [Dyella kyungheensis]